MKRSALVTLAVLTVGTAPSSLLFAQEVPRTQRVHMARSDWRPSATDGAAFLDARIAGHRSHLAEIARRWDFLPILGIVALLVGCAGSPALDAATERAPEAVPPHRKLIAEEIKKFKKQEESDRLEISEPRWTEHLGGPAWLVCVKFNTDAVYYYYAFFIRKESLIETRIAVGTDRCGQEAYTSFDLKQHT